jgi:hypothetical protein
MNYTKSANHDAETWILDTPEKILKKKSMLLVKKLRILNAPITDSTRDKYFNLGVQIDKFKLKFL